MVLPTITAGVACYLLLYFIFRAEISKPLTPPEIDPKSALRDKPGAYLGFIMLGICLGLLSLAPVFNLDMGIITFVFAMIMLGQDLLDDIKKHHLNPNLRKFDTTKTALARMSWKIAPFVICMFILVEVLETSGWIALFASSVGGVQNTIGLVAGIFFMGFLSSFACNIMNNQPMTILFTKMLQNPAFTTSPAITQSSMYALIMGSNFGANFTLIGALAGIIWSGISKEKEVSITYKQFAKFGFKVMPLVVALACLILALEFLFWV